MKPWRSGGIVEEWRERDAVVCDSGFCFYVDSGAVYPKPQGIPGLVVGCGFGGVPGGVGAMKSIYTVLDKPGMFENWQQAVRVLWRPVVFGLLVWAAVYELVKW